MVWSSGAFSGVTWHAGVISGGVWWGLSTAVTLHTRLAMAVMNSFSVGTFVEHKKEIIDSYLEACNEARGSMKELRRIRDSYSGISCEDLTRFQAYKHAFIAEAKRLQSEPALLSNHEAIEFLYTLPCSTYSRWTPLESRWMMWTPGGLHLGCT